ncbi:glycoside hydrolase 64/thaumatin family protein [Halobacillus amylolyticus]|uniref:Uncharacterized protein n=1 Tax=Halobacillus amylolyticus TaxID=2932259 RepID=A0ABY4H9P5_9BACI|nr:hypothetical protein [Halobacillus amylolyticus]UOR11604.1 hypothetical protein MUO15_18815 [Halobacillus amylolyticus]
MKKLGQITAALLMVVVLSFGGFVGSNFINTVEASSTGNIIGSTSLGSDWQSGRTGFQAGCAFSEWLGLFECHSSQVPWR